MPTITGTVSNFSQKTVNTKFGPKPTYSIMVDGQWYRSGFKKPQVNPGDTVAIEYDLTKYGSEITNMTVIGGGGMVATSGVSTAPSTPAAPATDTRSMSIIRQSSLNRAVDLFIASADGTAFNFEDLDSDKLDGIISVAEYFTLYCQGLNIPGASESEENSGE